MRPREGESHKTEFLIALVVKTKVSTLLEKKTLKEALGSLYDVILELKLQTISISRTDMDNVWLFLRELFYDSPSLR